MMKTKHLFASALALPLLFTACSQEDFVTVNNSSNPALANRKTVENVTINLDGSNTRMVFDGGYQWELNDRFGACLMDEYKTDGATAGNWWSYFTLVDYIQTNYPFTRQENGRWTSEAVMQEGNYFFYYPYNYNLGGKRTPIVLEVPTEQVVKKGASPSSVLDNQLFVGYERIVADETKTSESLNLTMQPLLAFPAFNLKNVGTGSLVVEKIAFSADSKKWPTEYEIKPFVGESEKFNNAGFATMGAAAQRAELVKIARPNEEASKVTVTFEGGIELSSQEDVWVYMMLPPVTSKMTNPKLEIYTNVGLGTVELGEVHLDAGSGTTNITNDRALTKFDYNDGAAVNITFDNTSMDQPFELTANTTSDLESLVNWSKNNTDPHLTATVTGDRVEISKAVYDVLNSNKNMTLLVKCETAGGATVTIPEGIPADVLDRIEFSNVNIVNKTDLTVAKDIKHSTYAPAKITNEGTMTLTAYSYSLAGTKIVNNGTITFDYSNPNGRAAELEWTGSNGMAIENNGEIVFDAHTNVNGSGVNGGIQNYGKVTINKGITVAGRMMNESRLVNNAAAVAEIVVNGTWNAAICENKGTITVSESGKINGSQYFTNMDEVELRNNLGVLLYTSSIKNSGNIQKVVNKGTITMESTSARLNTAAGGEGQIDNTVGSAYVQKGSEDETIFCKVTEAIEAQELNALVIKTNADRLDISGEITLGKNAAGAEVTDCTINVATVNAIGDLKINVPNKKLRFYKGTTGTNFNILSGETEVTSNSTFALRDSGGNITAGNLTIASGASFTIAGGAVVAATVDDDTEKIIENYGTLME